MSKSEGLTHIPPEGDSGRNEKRRSLDEIRNGFKQRFLIIDDGYDYGSEIVPDTLPTFFHGTSAWFEEDIKHKGLTNTVDDIQDVEDVFRVHPDMLRIYKWAIARGEGIRSRMKPHENSWRKKVYCTYSHENAVRYTKGPEILTDYLEVMEGWSGSFSPEPYDLFLKRVVSELGDIDSHEKRLLMSCIDPKGLVVYAKPTKEEFDAEETLKYGGTLPEITFLTSTKGRRELFDKIKWARERYIKHEKGDLVRINESSKMWDYIQTAADNLEVEEFELIPMADLVQIYLRHNLKEYLFKQIDPGSITKLERV